MSLLVMEPARGTRTFLLPLTRAQSDAARGPTARRAACGRAGIRLRDEVAGGGAEADGDVDVLGDQIKINLRDA
jgi:hypothetical protein